MKNKDFKIFKIKLLLTKIKIDFEFGSPLGKNTAAVQYNTLLPTSDVGG